MCRGKSRSGHVPIGEAGTGVNHRFKIGSMMSIRAVHAGSGYRYLLRSVATNDAEPDPEVADRLSEYYAAKGTPPGRWRGSGLAGLHSDTAQPGHEITADQMAALYGEGLHPDADAMIDNGVALKDCKLGRAYGIYTGGSAMLADLAKQEKSFRDTHGRRPDEAERSDIATRVGFDHYAAAHHGVSPTSAREVLAWVNSTQDNVKQAVAGFDLTFSPVKSVSVLWALADKDTAGIIAAAHHAAVADALSWVENNALFTRVGVNGIQQLKTNGLVASEFTHFDTRAGDPDLHSHVLVSNKVQVADTPEARQAGKVGEWKTIDGSQFFEHTQAASGVYNTALQQRLTEALGVEFTAVSTGRDAEPVWEIAGVPTTLTAAFSSRRQLAKPAFDALVADYVSTHGRQPSRRTNYRLWQTAILQTRDAKKPADSLDELRERWHQAAVTTADEATVTGLVDTVRTVTPTRPAFTAEDVDRVAATAIDRVLSRRATFKRSHIHTAVSQQLRGFTFADSTAVRHAYEAVMDVAINRMSVSLTPSEILELPDALTTTDGVGIDRKNNAEVYSTVAQLDRENRILTAAEAIAPVFVASEKFDAAVDAFAADHGFSLNDGQVAMARYLTGAGTQLAVAVGPAGTGKTTSMELVADLWTGQGRSVIGLAPSAAAAKILGEDIGAPARTIDSLTFVWNTTDGTAADKLAALPVELKPGDMLLVDEAGMASTDRLATLVDIAKESGAVIRMVGDPGQLDAVETGGVFRSLCRNPDTPMLTEVMRMGDDRDQADATLKIRTGNVDGLGLYFDRDWVQSGSRDEMLTAAVDAYLTDTAEGLRSMVIAPTNADVKMMNEIIQSHRLSTGTVRSTGGTRALSDGLTAHVGDTVLARKNQVIGDGDSGTRVLNGQLLTVRQITSDGALHCFDPQSQSQVTLPADYVASHTQLGYASTVHRAQGATVDTTHSLVDAKLDRNGLYVAVTRGKTENRLYVDVSAPLDTDAEDGHVHHSGDEDAPSAEHILHGIVHHDHTQLSAIDELRAQQDAATDPERITALYREGVARATTVYTDTVTPSLIDSLPVAVAAGIEADPDGREAIEHAVSYAASHGVDARELWAQASEDLDGADSAGRVIAWRLRSAVDHTTTTDVDAVEVAGDGPVLSCPPPRIPGTDMELAGWLDTTYKNLTTPTDGETVQEETTYRPEAVEWVDRVRAQSSGLDGLSATELDAVVGQVAAAMQQGVDLDGQVPAAAIRVDGLVGPEGTPVSRLSEFIVEELSAAEADDTDYTGGDSSATDYGHAMTDYGYDYGAGGLDLGGDQQWDTGTGLDLD